MNLENQDDRIPDCGRVRNELAAFVYGELAPDVRSAVDQHLAGCGACREELGALRETHQLLSRWETPAVKDDVALLARSIAAEARAPLAPARPRARLVRWVAALSGAAAAGMFALSVLQVRMSHEGGRFELSFALPGALAHDAPLELSPAAVRTIAAQEVSALEQRLELSQEELFQRCKLASQQECARLAEAVDYTLASNQRAIDTSLNDLGRAARRADLETRQAVTNLASYVSQPNR